MILHLLFINLIVMLAHESGFFDYMDDWVSRKWRFHHLPKIMVCGLCQTFWLSVLYILVTGNIGLLPLVLCFLNAHLSEITTGVFRIAKKAILDALGWINDKI